MSTHVDKTKLLVYCQTMITVNVYELKTHLSRYLEMLEQGQTVVVCRRNVPIAELRPLSRPPAKRRPVGLMKGLFQVPDSFFEPLPEQFLEDLYGSVT